MAHLPALSIRAAVVDLLRQAASSAGLLQGGNGEGKMSVVDTGLFSSFFSSVPDRQRICLTIFSFFNI